MFFRKSHAKVQIIFDMCKYHQFISQILSFYFTNIINLFHDIIIFGIYIPVDTMRYCPCRASSFNFQRPVSV
jgi:hypothetical protein